MLLPCPLWTVNFKQIVGLAIYLKQQVVFDYESTGHSNRQEIMQLE